MEDEEEEGAPEMKQTRDRVGGSISIMSETYKADETGLSDSEEELEQYDPMPYAFILKDVYRNPLVVAPEKLHNAKITCPSFHILLDHVVAVLWCFYSRSGHHKLGTSQLHWAIKFLEGLRDWQNRYTPDVSMAIDDLEGALVEIAAAVDESIILNRTYGQEETAKMWDFSIRVTDKSSYDDFAAALARHDRKLEIHDPDTDMDFSFMKFDRSHQLNATRIGSESSMRVESPSIIINDLLGDEKQALTELLDSTKADMDSSKVCVGKSAALEESPPSFTENYVALRNELINKTIRQLEQIKNIDETLNSSFRCQIDPENLSQLKEKLGDLSTVQNT